MIARILIIWLALMIPAAADPVPEGFVEIRDIIPDPVMDIRYVTDHNFLGTPVDGYRASRCYLTKEAATALAGVQTDFKPFGFSIKLYDCYRPQRVVGHFVRWAKNIDDTATRTWSRTSGSTGCCSKRSWKDMAFNTMIRNGGILL